MPKAPTLILALALGLTGISWAEPTNPAKASPGQQIAPDGSEVDPTKGGPLAVPFGGTDKETEKTVTSSSKKFGSAMTGTIESVSGHTVRIKDAQGRTRIYRMTEQTVTTDPQAVSGVILKKGDAVRVRFNEKTMVLQNVQIFH